MKDIAFQARCALGVLNGVAYLKYLPEEPTSVQTLTVSDIESGSVNVSLTPTEDTITKMIVNWRMTWSGEPDKYILRNNNGKYGHREETFDFFCYNQPDIVMKMATFWMIRKSNTYKRLTFRGFLNLLKLEPNDGVTLRLPDWVANDSVTAIVEKARYNSESNSIEFEVLAPLRSGEMGAYSFFWPANLSTGEVYQSTTINTGVNGSLPVGYMFGVGG